MFGHNYFYHGTIRKSINIFGNMMNQIYIKRFDSSGNVAKLIKVPIVYGPKDAAWVRTDSDPEIKRPAAVVLPVMTFQEDSYGYASDRKLNSTRYIAREHSTDNDLIKFSYMPVPYDIFFTLNVYANEIADGLKVIEQILPHFGPSYTITADMVPELDLENDIPVTLMSISKEYITTGQLTERRSIIWTLNFKMSTLFHGPVIDKPLIKLSNTNFLLGNVATANTDENLLERVVVTPGLDANGAGTTNASITIASANININDPYDYIVTRVSANSSGG